MIPTVEKATARNSEVQKTCNSVQVTNNVLKYVYYAIIYFLILLHDLCKDSKKNI